MNDWKSKSSDDQGLLFETYIAFCNFAVLNVMTGAPWQSWKMSSVCVETLTPKKIWVRFRWKRLVSLLADMPSQIVGNLIFCRVSMAQADQVFCQSAIESAEKDGWDVALFVSC